LQNVSTSDNSIYRNSFFEDYLYSCLYLDNLNSFLPQYLKEMKNMTSNSIDHEFLKLGLILSALGFINPRIACLVLFAAFLLAVGMKY